MSQYPQFTTETKLQTTQVSKSINLSQIAVMITLNDFLETYHSMFPHSVAIFQKSQQKVSNRQAFNNHD